MFFTKIYNAKLKHPATPTITPKLVTSRFKQTINNNVQTTDAIVDKIILFLILAFIFFIM
jgi:hypothetical protein